jgi:hypothetical protein
MSISSSSVELPIIPGMFPADESEEPSVRPVTATVSFQFWVATATSHCEVPAILQNDVPAQHNQRVKCGRSRTAGSLLKSAVVMREAAICLKRHLPRNTPILHAEFPLTFLRPGGH